MRKKRFSSSKDDELEENLINLTPLIDVVFVVLIAFILIAPMLELDHIDLATSGNKTVASSVKSPISLYIKKDSSIWLDNKCLTLSELRDHLVEKKKHYPEVIPQVFPDDKSSFGSYQSAKDLLEECGFEQMDVILKPN